MRALARAPRGWDRTRLAALLSLAAGLLALGALVAWSAGQQGLPQLPYLAARSVARMAVAFVLSTLFALAYGHTAATSPRAARVMVPLLDILQSIPILGFFPAAILFFVALFHGSPLGLEAASVFLIFTSQNWNMTFGVYEAVRTLPKETADAASVFGLRGALRLRRVILPATVPRLVYNGIVSWAGGWYFVTASEIISANGAQTTLPGLGSFLFRAAAGGDGLALAAGIAVLVLVVVVFELLAWRPLQVWAERFKFEVATGPRVVARSRALAYWRVLAGRGGQAVVDAGARAHPGMTRARLPPPAPSRARPGLARAVRLAAALVAGLVLAVALALVSLALVQTLRTGLPADAPSIPLALLASTARLLAAYAITVAWTVPVAIFIAQHDRASRLVLPLTEVLASVPAVALFPVIVLLLVGVTGGLGLPSVLLVLTGMQWYLLFNLIAGARGIPADLLAAARVEGVRGWLMWKRVMLPAMMPSFVTGSITAWGGGWNALIVSEYVDFGGRTYHTFGIGYLIDKATFEAPDPALLLLSVLSMAVFIWAVNRAVWKPLYAKAVTKYRMEA